jgi:hypothetical protein
MPKKPMDYSKTTFYKIVCDDLDVEDIYIGHTTNFTKRKYQHKNGCNNKKHHAYNTYVYKFIRENGGWDNWSMIEIEKRDCDDRQEAGKRERYWFEKLHATLNKAVPTRTNDQYHIDNKQREAKIKNKKHICCSGKYTHANRVKHFSSKKHIKYIDDRINAQFAHICDLHKEFEKTYAHLF